MAHSNSDNANLAERLPIDGKLGAIDAMTDLINRALPEVEIIYILVPPQGLPRMLGALYFRIEVLSEAWGEIQHQKTAALFLSAGVEFYQHLETMPESYIIAREVSGLVLLAGFTGCYATRPRNELVEYCRRCLRQIFHDKQIQSLEPNGLLFFQPNNMQKSCSRIINSLMAVLIFLVLFSILGRSTLYISLERPLMNIASRLIGMK